jgi:hypothetical protein
LTAVKWVAVLDEVEGINKSAGVPARTILGRLRQFAAAGAADIGTAAQRVANPLEGIPAGWRAMRPQIKPEEARRIVQKGQKGGWFTRTFGEGSQKHLLDKPRTIREALGRGELSSELSRRGWTGRGKVTKYMPLGQKGLTAGFAASAIPSITSAPKATPTGEGGRYEQLMREVGGTGGFVMGGGLGMAPAMGLASGGSYVGGKFGRVLDRLRSGANIVQAVEAPSPTEASQQMSRIRKYYG